MLIIVVLTEIYVIKYLRIHNGITSLKLYLAVRIFNFLNY